MRPVADRAHLTSRGREKNLFCVELAGADSLDLIPRLVGAKLEQAGIFVSGGGVCPVKSFAHQPLMHVRIVVSRFHSHPPASKLGG